MFERNENERELARGLEALAESLPEHAPLELKARLQAAFRQHAAVQRRRQRIRRLGIAAAIVLVALPLREPIVPRAGDPGAFIALDDGAFESGLVLRVKLPRSMLGDESAFAMVEADVLLGNDGMAHAVRLVQ